MENIKNLRPLGHTGIMISPIVPGCWQFSKQKNLAGKFWPTLEDELFEKVVAIPGATKEIHAKENIGAMSFRLSDEDIVRLDNVSSIFR